MSKTLEEKRADRRAHWASARKQALEGASCAHCGSTEDLELDHIDPSTKVSHIIWQWSAERIAAELAKCQWLCCLCHRKKSRDEQIAAWGPRVHGTMRMYEYGRCRCADCRAANAARNRRRKVVVAFGFALAGVEIRRG